MVTAKKKTTTAGKISDETLRCFVGYHMKRAFNVIKADLTEVLKPLELRMLTYTALVLIKDNPGLSQSQLADAMDIERPNLIVIVDELECRELIVRERVPTDRRTYALKVTLAGRRLCEKAIRACQAHEDRLFADLDSGSRKTVINALAMVSQRPSTKSKKVNSRK